MWCVCRGASRREGERKGGKAATKAEGRGPNGNGDKSMCWTAAEQVGYFPSPLHTVVCIHSVTPKKNLLSEN